MLWWHPQGNYLVLYRSWIECCDRLSCLSQNKIYSANTKKTKIKQWNYRNYYCSTAAFAKGSQFKTADYLSYGSCVSLLVVWFLTALRNYLKNKIDFLLVHSLNCRFLHTVCHLVTVSPYESILFQPYSCCLSKIGKHIYTWKNWHVHTGTPFFFISKQ